MISEFIFYDETGTKEEKSLYINLKVKVRNMLKDDFKRRTISEILLELRKDVSGAAQKKLFELFQDLELHQDSYKKLESWRWEVISSGIQELTRMEVEEAYSFLTKFINDKRTTIRKQAEIAVVTLNSEGIGYFLDSTRHKISEWQQLKLIEVLSNKTDFIPPSFKAWLVSKNKYVVLFALRLIKYYDQNNAGSSIVELVKHRDNQIKQEAIDCIKAFHLTVALPTLKKVFWSCSTEIKITILDAIANLGTPEDVPFLKSIKKKERNYSVTSKALGAINAIIPESVLPTEGILSINDVDIPEDLPVEEPTTQELDQFEEASEEIPQTKELERLENEVGISDSKSKDDVKTESVHVNAVEVEFSSDFLPLVTPTADTAVQEPRETNPSINDLDVVYEAAYEKYVPDAQETELADPNSLDVIIDLEFLPLVVPSKTSESKDPIDIEVNFELVQPISKEINHTVELKVEEIIVIYDVLIPTAAELENALKAIEVDFEKVTPTNVEISFELEDELSQYIDFEIVFNNGEPPLRIPKVENNEVFDFDVSLNNVEEDLEIDRETESPAFTPSVELPSWLLDEIANENQELTASSELVMEGEEWEAKQSQMIDLIQGYIEKLPAVPRQDELADTIQLLDDIELFGDEREIPLLQELMEKEDKAQTKKRIDGLMKRFVGTDTYGGGLENGTTYSVFEELFRNCDTESKLILLDEIVMIGDEKEAAFLEQLLDDPISEISTKAAKALKLLNQRLERIASGIESKDADEYERFINMMDLNPPKQIKEPSYFQIDFELNREEENSKIRQRTKYRKGFGSYFSQFMAKLIKNTNFF